MEVGAATGAARVHDVGTGCGAIALALKALRPELAVSGSDISPEAVTVARMNATRLDLDVEFRVADGVPPDPMPTSRWPICPTSTRARPSHSPTAPASLRPRLPCLAATR